MTTSNMNRALKALPLAALLALFGCASDDGHKSKPADTTVKQESAKKAEPMSGTSMQGDMSKSVMAFPTGDRSTSVLALETLAPVEVRVNQAYDYMMSITNLTNLNIENVTVTDNTQGAFAMASSTPPATKSAGGVNEWNLGRMGPGETKTIRVSGKATGTGSITRCATVSYNSQSCIVTRVVQPDLKLEKTATAEVLACDPIMLTFKVTNTGSGAARNVVVEDPLPQGWTTMDGAKSIMINAGTLEAGQSRDFTAQVKAAAPGSYDNTAMAKADGGLEAKSNTTKTVVRQPVLTIVKKCSEKRFIGRPIEYEITVTNTGDGVAKGTMVEDMLPAGVKFVSATDGGVNAGGKVSWSFGDMAPKASKTVKCTVTAAAGGVLKNEAMARAYCAAAVNAACSTTVEGVPALLLEVVDLEDAIEVGAEFTYEITVTNQGTAVGENIVIKVGLDESMKFVAAGGQTNPAAAVTAASGGNFSYLALPSLGAGQKAKWTLRIKALKADDARLSVSMSAKGFARPYDETEGTRFY